MRQIREDQSRQADRDREYLKACREAGIEPDAPKYIASGGGTVPAHLEAIALNEGNLKEFPDEIFCDEEGAKELPEFKIPKTTRTAFEGLLSILLPSRRTFFEKDVLTAGRRAVVVAWMIGKGPLAGQSLSKIAPRLGVTRAALSHICRHAEKTCGFRARGQKSISAQEKYREARLRVLEREKVEKHAPRMPEKSFSDPDQGQSIATD